MFLAEEEHRWARVEEVGDAGERREVGADLVEHVLAADEVVGVLAVDGDRRDVGVSLVVVEEEGESSRNCLRATFDRDADLKRAEVSRCVSSDPIG